MFGLGAGKLFFLDGIFGRGGGGGKDFISHYSEGAGDRECRTVIASRRDEFDGKGRGVGRGFGIAVWEISG